MKRIKSLDKKIVKKNSQYKEERSVSIEKDLIGQKISGPPVDWDYEDKTAFTN